MKVTVITKNVSRETKSILIKILNIEFSIPILEAKRIIETSYDDIHEKYTIHLDFEFPEHLSTNDEKINFIECKFYKINVNVMLGDIESKTKTKVIELDEKQEKIFTVTLNSNYVVVNRKDYENLKSILKELKIILKNYEDQL